MPVHNNTYTTLQQYVDDAMAYATLAGLTAQDLGGGAIQITFSIGDMFISCADNVEVYSQSFSIITSYYVNCTPVVTYTSPSSCSPTDYRFGFNGMEKDNEAKGVGNHLSFSDYGYNPRIGRRWRSDPKSTVLPNLSPYLYCLNSPIQTIDPDGKFPILINGRTAGGDHQRASSTYWDKSTLDIISSNTGYSMGASFNGTSEGNSRFSNDFYFVDGNKGFWAGTRREAGIATAAVDAQAVWNKLKTSMNAEGQITEQIQVITHSRGAAFGEGYMEGLRTEVLKLAEAEGVGFAYDKNSLIEYSVNLAPHQSNSLNYPETATMNVNISHVGDPLSGNDATGDVINVHSIPEKEANPIDQHGLELHNTELSMILKTLEGTAYKESLLLEVKLDYLIYDNNRNNGGTSTVTKAK